MSQPDPRQAVQTSPQADPPTKESANKPVPPWNWRLIVFLWFSALLFLGLYEFLYTLLRALFR